MEVEEHGLYGASGQLVRSVRHTWVGRLRTVWQWHAEDLTQDLPGGSRTAYRVGAACTP
ncbi:hypothetical protein Ais01nite_54100 [Asanoa ishikariensis]|nr:hypothetical protein Ais01nite_54100 [Asanoa ishikariensis]